MSVNAGIERYERLLEYVKSLPDPLKGVVIDWLESLPCDMTNLKLWQSSHACKPGFKVLPTLTITTIDDAEYTHEFTPEEVSLWVARQESV